MSGPLLTGSPAGASLAEPSSALVLTSVPSLLILGTDVVVAASSATAVQLMHACLACGYDAVIPASWGDELIAARALERMREGAGACVQCSCPHVSGRLAAHTDVIGPMLLHFVAPPEATARYLRALYGPVRPHITFAGGCPSGASAEIDEWLHPAHLLARFTDKGITLSAQPTEFDSVLPPDRRRFYSEPGGAPSRSALRQSSPSLERVELKGADLVLDLAQELLSSKHALIDVAPRLGCACSGAVPGVKPEGARAKVREHEPPRAPGPVVDHSVRVVLETDPPARAYHVPPAPEPVPSPPPRVTPIEVTPPPEEPAMAVVEVGQRRRSPPSGARPVLGTMPLARRDDGRQLPRAYIARRRSSPRNVRLDPALLDADVAPSIKRGYFLWVAVVVGIGLGVAIAWLVGFG
jgi:hypothetical protein